MAAHGLAGECRLVDIETHRLKQIAVGRYLLAGVEHHDVAYHYIAARNLGAVAAVAYHLHRLVVVDLIEDRELAVGLYLKPERQTGRQQYGHEYADRLEEHRHPLVERIVFIERYAHREHTYHEQNHDKRRCELLQKQFPQRRALGPE